MKTKHFKRINIGSVISGTMRPEDLIPAFIYELRQQKPLHREHRKLIREIEAEAYDSKGEYREHELESENVDALFDALNDYAPPYFYFGAHSGDGADYGFWLSDNFAEEFDGGLKVSDLSEVPRGYSGEVLHINDHGNLTLYYYSRGRGREVWAIV